MIKGSVIMAAPKISHCITLLRHKANNMITGMEINPMILNKIGNARQQPVRTWEVHLPLGASLCLSNTHIAITRDSANGISDRHEVQKKRNCGEVEHNKMAEAATILEKYLKRMR